MAEVHAHGELKEQASNGDSDKRAKLCKGWWKCDFDNGTAAMRRRQCWRLEHDDREIGRAHV